MTLDRSTVTFGRPLLSEWQLDPSITYLNHGTVGATPRVVLDAQRRLQDEIERNPSKFLLRELSPIRVGHDNPPRGRLREAAEAVGRSLGAAGDNLVFVDNATAGINAVLRSLALQPGDEILITDLAYGAIHNAATFAARQRGATVVRIELPHPLGDPADAIRVIDDALTTRTRLAIVDHVTSESALVLPLGGIAQRCRERGVLVLADGAHAPGAIPLDIEALDVDFYAANLHKWAWAPRSCGILWAAPRHHTWLHPPVISWGLYQGFTTEFDWVGTRDPTPALTAPTALALMDEFGADRVWTYNHHLAWTAARWLSEHWSTAFDTPETMIGVMATVPLPESAGSTPEDAARLRDRLLFDDRIEAQIHGGRERLWVRISAQIYTEMADIERLARAIDARVR